MTDRFPGTFSAAQTAQLLAPIRPNRVLKDGKNNSHVSQQDVTAHLIRVFGFGNFSTELLHLECLFEECRNPDADYRTRKWDVGYRATMRLTIFDEHHNLVTYYEDASTGDAQNQVRHDAHDLAMKSAISLAKKRCTINLGDQFGLSLYNKGQMEALVRGSLVMPEAPQDAAPAEDVQEGVPQQESMGVDEIEKEPEATEEQEAALAASVGRKKAEPKAEEPPAEEPPAERESRGEGTPEKSEEEVLLEQELGAEKVAEEPVTEEPPAGDPADEPGSITRPQHAKIGALMKEAGVTTNEGARSLIGEIIGRTVMTRTDLSKNEARKIIDTLEPGQ